MEVPLALSIGLDCRNLCSTNGRRGDQEELLCSHCQRIFHQPPHFLYFLQSLPDGAADQLRARAYT